ncbi:riboflavin biosynthesis protein RibF [Myxococcota bacterium]|nr:riboflavin biosynthesis protein RibF [Myxococcota bacterium]MBU1432624.1 riboflavin biosynthesis protein RibF [Myxococcota bacterium]MBU1899513.1 riboflavin biosynthesis protein RibF [Myxococcota bacterium]
MLVFDDHRAARGHVQAAAVTIGNFDGLHQGHAALLNVARALPGPTVALTFTPHPLQLFAPDQAPPQIYSHEDRQTLMRRVGVDLLLAQRFDHAFAALSPEAFAGEVLKASLDARHVIVGYDFAFGARRAGDLDALRRLGAALGFEVHVCPPVRDEAGAIISSTLIRQRVEAGDVTAACAALGRPYHLAGRIVQGARRGRRLGFPTANLEAEGALRPKPGVYSGWLDWGDGPRPAVINVGANPTFVAEQPLSVEAHVLNAVGLALYATHCHLYFGHRLRDERRFDGPSALIAQIHIDIERAAALLDGACQPQPL